MENYKGGIKFTSGTIKSLCDKYFTLTLFNNSNIVYKSTIPKNIIDVVCTTHKNIKHEK